MPKKERPILSKDVLRKTGFIQQIYTEGSYGNREKLVTSFIQERLNRVDISGVVELIGVAAAAKIENKPEADQIINSVSDYLISSPDEPILKTLTNIEKEGGENASFSKLLQAVKTVYEMKDQMSPIKRQEMFEGKNNHILRLINDINSQISQPISDIEGNWSLVPVNLFGRNIAEQKHDLSSDDLSQIKFFDEGMKHKEKLLRAVLSLMNGLNEENETQVLAHLPTFIIEKLQDDTELNMYWEKSYGGVSLKQIFTETSLSKKKTKFLEFLNHVPRGDIFWHTIIDGSLLGRFAVTDEDGIHKTNNSATILGLQYSIVSDLLINQSNSKKTPKLLKAFEELQIPMKPLLRSLEASYYFYTMYISKNGQRVFSDQLLAEFLQEKNNLPAIFIDEFVDWYLKKNMEKIQAHLSDNAPSEKVKNEIRQWGIEKMKYSYIEAHTEEILTSIRYVMGEQLWKMLFVDAEQQQKTKDVTDSIISSILERKLWPAEGIDRIEKFDKGTLPFMFGIDNIKFGLDPAHSDIMAAAIQLRYPRKIAVIASIQNINGNLDINFSIDPKENKEILQMLKLIIAVELEDNLADIKLNNGTTSRSKEPPRSTTGKIELIKNRLVQDATPLPIEKKTRSKRPDETTSTDLTGRLNDHATRLNAEFRPRIVACHARLLCGASNYLDAVKNYQEFKSSHNIGSLTREEEIGEYDSISYDLRLTLGQMDMISNRKELLIPSLSDDVQKNMERVINPVDGKERLVSTWVISYESPKPDESIAGDLRRYYENYVKNSEGPSSAVYNPILVKLSKETNNS